MIAESNYLQFRRVDEIVMFYILFSVWIQIGAEIVRAFDEDVFACGCLSTNGVGEGLVVV